MIIRCPRPINYWCWSRFVLLPSGILPVVQSSYMRCTDKLDVSQATVVLCGINCMQSYVFSYLCQLYAPQKGFLSDAPTCEYIAYFKAQETITYKGM